MKQLTTQDFIKKSKTIFGDRYDYSSVDYKHSLEKVKIICGRHGEFWIKPSNHINNKQGCNRCGKESTGEASRKGIETLLSQIKEKEGFENYDFSLLNFKTRRDKVAVVCKKHGKFETTPRNLIRSGNCWGCANCQVDADRFTSETFIEKSSRKHNNYYDYSKVDYVKSHFPVTIICPKHGEFSISAYIHIVGKGFCPKCTDFVSSYEVELSEFLKGRNIEFETSYRKFKNIKEVDIVSHDPKIGIEFNGLYWHSDIFKDNKYHLNKSNQLKDLGYRLIHIFEDEWINKKDICKSIILNSLQKTPNKIHARQCDIKEVSFAESKAFLEKNHIQGNCVSKFRLGLYHNNQLFSLMTFGKTRICLGSAAENGAFELLRFCNSAFVSVVGGASKLFSYFINNYHPTKVISYCDKRWGTGNLYSKLNFNYLSDSKPNYFYVKAGKRFNRFTFRKNELIKLGYDANKTEKEIMIELGYNRIYDCGCMKFEWNE